MEHHREVCEAGREKLNKRQLRHPVRRFELLRREIATQIRLADCIQARLVPFLDQNHGDEDCFFWPVRLRGHYAEATQELYGENDLAWIPKAVNPPNCPHLHLIPNFWGWLNAKLYNNGWEAKAGVALQRHIHQKMNEFSVEEGQRLFSDLRSMLSTSAGLLSVAH